MGWLKKSTFGYLYNCRAVDNAPAIILANNGSKNICPFGWHVPSDADWNTLSTFLGSGTIVGGALKEAGFTHWPSPNGDATNSSGFTALPGGSWSLVYYNRSLPPMRLHIFGPQAQIMALIILFPIFRCSIWMVGFLIIMMAGFIWVFCQMPSELAVPDKTFNQSAPVCKSGFGRDSVISWKIP